MKAKTNSKVMELEELVKTVRTLQQAGKSVVLSHGVYDLIHPGNLKHLEEAAKQGDVLVVTVIRDSSVRKGPGRPIFHDKMRAEAVAALSFVDYVSIVDDDVPYGCLKIIRPDVFAKGRSFNERDKEAHDKLFEAKKSFIDEKCKVIETSGFSFSSSEIINGLLEIIPDETKRFLKMIADKYPFNDIVSRINDLKKLKVLIIGDGIIDEYHYCESMGKSPKSQLIVHRYINHEVFAGGAFAIANHVAGICEKVDLVTVLGQNDAHEEFIRQNMKPNIGMKFFHRKDGSTIVKRRFINRYQKQKVFEVNYMNDEFISRELEDEMLAYFAKMDDYDVVLVSDFGHGLVTPRMIECFGRFSDKLAVNTQTNGANIGYNLITKYCKTRFICLDGTEARLATQKKYADMSDVAAVLMKNVNTDSLMITVGSEGSICLTGDGVLNHTPALSTRVVDIIGAGDAFFSYTAPCFMKKMPVELVSFIGNVVGALAIQIVGNKKPVEKAEVLELIYSLYKAVGRGR